MVDLRLRLYVAAGFLGSLARGTWLRGGGGYL